MAPPKLASRLRSLPPILHNSCQNPISGYSKGSRGLSVPPRVVRIFTDTPISPSLLPRHRPSRYTIRAGRNLPDKEFRYLRTVIVTAAVYRGFNSEREPLLLTFRHRAGVSPYTSSYDLAETCVFGKQSPGPLLCNPFQLRTYPCEQFFTYLGPPFFLSYGVKLPSSLARVSSNTLGYSPHPPVSVYSTVAVDLTTRFFLAPLRHQLQVP